MEKILDYSKLLLPILGTTIAWLFGTWDNSLTILIVFMILDYVTGTIKSKVTHTESSNKGLLGIVKKVCYWILILIAFLISFLLMQIGSKLNINLEFVMLFGWFTLACLIINESRSIIENLVEIGIDVPEILTKGLNVYESVLKSKSKALTNDEKKEGK